MSLRLPSVPFLHLSAAQPPPTSSRSVIKFSVRNCSSEIHSDTSRKLVMKVKEKLEKDYYSLPTGKNGRDDEELILWFLKDRRFSVDEAISKLTKAIKWRQEFHVSEITEESVKEVAATGKSYLHDSLDVNGRPVLIVVPSKHTPEMFEQSEDERLCVFLLEKALSKLPEGKEEILGIFDLRGFSLENSDLKFLTFLFDVLYYYYPRRLGQVLFVEAPFVFQPIWQLAKPLVKSYASLVYFLHRNSIQFSRVGMGWVTGFLLNGSCPVDQKHILCNVTHPGRLLACFLFGYTFLCFKGFLLFEI